jgi:deoxyribose-phosphate aldolase
MSGRPFLDVLLEMATAGVTRFGATATAAILDDLARRRGGVAG